MEGSVAATPSLPVLQAVLYVSMYNFSRVQIKWYFFKKEKDEFLEADFEGSNTIHSFQGFGTYYQIARAW